MIQGRDAALDLLFGVALQQDRAEEKRYRASDRGLSDEVNHRLQVIRLREQVHQVSALDTITRSE